MPGIELLHLNKPNHPEQLYKLSCITSIILDACQFGLLSFVFAAIIAANTIFFKLISLRIFIPTAIIAAKSNLHKLCLLTLPGEGHSPTCYPKAA